MLIFSSPYRLPSENKYGKKSQGEETAQKNQNRIKKLQETMKKKYTCYANLATEPVKFSADF